MTKNLKVNFEKEREKEVLSRPCAMTLNFKSVTLNLFFSHKKEFYLLSIKSYEIIIQSVVFYFCVL